MIDFLRKVYWALTGTDASAFLRPSLDRINQYKSLVIWKKIEEVDGCRLPTYPRFSILDKSKPKWDKQLIFDSSDFSEIKKELIGFSIEEGRLIEVKGIEYRISKVRVDIMGFFHDYSAIEQYPNLESKLRKKHTSVYEGRDVPYNIQIFIEVNVESLSK